MLPGVFSSHERSGEIVKAIFHFNLKMGIGQQGLNQVAFHTGSDEDGNNWDWKHRSGDNFGFPGSPKPVMEVSRGSYSAYSPNKS